MTTVHDTAKLVDRFGRTVNYLRISITDRCDFRCVYCMAEEMTFLPRSQILTLEEIYLITRAFVELGVTKIRITGGEPLVRKGAVELIEQIGRLHGLNELVMTTNGSQLATHAFALKHAGVKRINVSLDSLQSDKFRKLTRIGHLDSVLAGIAKAKAVGFKRIKINAVILKAVNDDEVCSLLAYAIKQGIDISFIEEMPLGIVDEHNRAQTFCSSAYIQHLLAQQFTLLPSSLSTGGPSNYFSIPGCDTQVGFISPHSNNFCSQCNRVRLTVEGRLLLCLGNEHSVDLKSVIRQKGFDIELLKQTIIESMDIKPERHEFQLDEHPVVLRYMNMTGG